MPDSPFYQPGRQGFGQSASQSFGGGFQQPSFSSQIFGGGSTSPQSFGGFGGGQGGFGGGFQPQGFGGFGGSFQPQGFGGGFNPMFGGIGSLGLNPMMGPQFGMQMPQFQQQFNPYQQQQFNPYQQQQFNPYQQQQFQPQFNPFQQQFQPQQFNPFQPQQFQPQYNPYQQMPQQRGLNPDDSPVGLRPNSTRPAGFMEQAAPQQFQPQVPQQSPKQLQEQYGLRPYRPSDSNDPQVDLTMPVMGDMMYRGGPPTARDMEFRRQREQDMRKAANALPLSPEQKYQQAQQYGTQEALSRPNVRLANENFLRSLEGRANNPQPSGLGSVDALYAPNTATNTPGTSMIAPATSMPSPAPQLSTPSSPFTGPKLTSQDIMDMAVKKRSVDLQYDMNKDGRITAADALAFSKKYG